MALPYPVRLLCLCFACFFLVHVALGTVVSLMSPLAVRFASRLRAAAAARLLLAIRLSPLTGGLLVVCGLCVPSYLRLEPERSVEEVGAVCLGAAALSAICWALSIARAMRAELRSRRCSASWRQAGREVRLPAESTPVWVVDGAPSPLALAGILRPRIFVSRQLVDALSHEQIAAALRHECAHRQSRDNFKRLAVLLAPGLLPIYRGFAALDRAWARFAEWAADDYAADGDSHRSLSLAAALVSAARMGPSRPRSYLVTSLLDCNDDLSCRVDRLLHVTPTPRRSRWAAAMASVGCVAVAALATSVTLQPGTMIYVHELLERLVG